MTDLHKRFAFDLHDKAALDENAFSVARARFGTNTEEQDRMLYQAILMYQSALATPAPLSDEPVAIYQMQLRGSDWVDVEKRTFDDLPRIRRRIVYAAPLAAPSDKQEAVGEVLLIGKDSDLKEVAWRKGKMPPVGTKLYAAPLAQSAEQDRIDAERYRWLVNGGIGREEIDEALVDGSREVMDAAIDAAIARGASK